MRPPGSPQELERRRRRAIVLLRAGENLSTVAHAVNASASSVHRWYQAYQRNGRAGLRPRPTPGRPSRLSASQCRRLLALLQRGPPAAGYPTELWTLKRMAEVIEKKFDVRYHPGHVWWLLERLGWSCQKPERRAREYDEEAVARWRRERWAHIKKRPSGRS
jgi:transposase